MKTTSDIKLHHQVGATLITTLVLLLVITIASIQLAVQTGTNKALTQNEVERMQTEQIAQNIANDILSDITHYITPASINVPAQYNGYLITYTPPVCQSAKEVSGYSLTAEIVPETSYWTFTVTVDDPITGATTTLDIGSKFNYTAGVCA